tara:strand:- start:2449 stop:3714 length:1266 start_codon:yes stop_codon:yes gene_type:complete
MPRTVKNIIGGGHQVNERHKMFDKIICGIGGTETFEAGLVPACGRSSLSSNFADHFLSDAVGEHAIISVTDVKGNITYVNNKFIEISGYTWRELVGQNHRMLKSKEHPPEFYRNLWKTIGGGETWHGDIKNLSKHGEEYWVKATIVPYLNDQRKPVKYLSIRTDITQVKAAERSKLESLKQQQASLDLIDAQVYMLWPDNLEVFYANRVARELSLGLGVNPSWQAPTFLAEGTTRADFKASLSPILSGEQDSICYQTDVPAPGGATFPAEITAQMIRPLDDKKRIFLSVKDISERRQLEKAKSNFIATVSHELRTPLTSIIGGLELIKMSLHKGETGPVSRLLEISRKNAMRLRKLIDDILDLDKLEAGKMNFKFIQFDLAQAIQDSVMEISSFQTEKNVSVQSFGVAAPVMVTGDRERLQ